MMYLDTGTGYEMFEMLSMMQKAIRRGDYDHAGFAAEQLKKKFRNAMWNRLLVISAEDCFGVVTKEVVYLREKEIKEGKYDETLSSVVALLCRVAKSRDACYFSCNFVLDNRCPRTLLPDEKLVKEYQDVAALCGDKKAVGFDRFGFAQESLFEQNNDFDSSNKNDDCYRDGIIGAKIEMAICHRDMNVLGYEMNLLRKDNRRFLWAIFENFAKKNFQYGLINEIEALKKADDFVNSKKSDKDEIFISKAAIILTQAFDGAIDTMSPSEIIQYDKCINWEDYKIKPIKDCKLVIGKIPDWVYDCHTYKGKKWGKTVWQMINTEQAALYPLKKCYFDEASWYYACLRFFQKGEIPANEMNKVKSFSETHQANPVELIPYEQGEIAEG